MDSVERLRNLFQELAESNDPDYLYEGLVLDFTEAVVAEMIRKNIKRVELAERLGTSRAWVTKLLDGQENMTLKTMVRVASALDMDVKVSLKKRSPGAATTVRSPKLEQPKPKPSSKKRSAAARSR